MRLRTPSARWTVAQERLELGPELKA